MNERASIELKRETSRGQRGHPKVSPRALAEWESLFEHLPSTEESSDEASTAVEHADLDRPSSPFHVYEWVVAKLRANPSTTFLDLERLAERGNFTVAEGHYKRARREVELHRRDSDEHVDALVAETLELLRGPIEDLRRMRAAAREIARICDDALSALDDE